MHDTHQFFLTKRSLYLLVLDARLDEGENRVDYWLRIIDARRIGWKWLLILLLFVPALNGTAAFLDVVLLAVLTGAFHLDGLGDTADGLFSPRSRDRALEIMKDSRIGVMGLVAIVFALGLKWGGIQGLDAHRSLLLVIVPAYARAGILFGMQLLDYGRTDGTGLPFFKNKLNWASHWGLLIPVGLSILLGWKAIWLNLMFAVIVGTILLFYRKRMGCITGDMLGAMTEVTEAGLFLIVSTGGC
jgi:adenosylcobinamide-GDP ribazoletransferase